MTGGDVVYLRRLEASPAIAPGQVGAHNLLCGHLAETADRGADGRVGGRAHGVGTAGEHLREREKMTCVHVRRILRLEEMGVIDWAMRQKPERAEKPERA